MKTQVCCKNLIFLSVLAAGFLLSAVFVSVYAAESDATPAPEQITAALEDLSTATGQTIGTKEAAAEVCDSEKYFTVCADVGKKHNLYKPEMLSQVDSLVNEIKGKIAEQLQNCQTTECLVNVANQLARKLNASAPTLATSLDLTPKLVEKKQAVVTAAKELGVNFDDCYKMDPDNAPIELLRACAKLAKDSRVKDTIPESVRKSVEGLASYNDKVVDFRSSLATGEFQCGDGTLNGCGNFCLNPNKEARAQGTAGIPSVCRDIAKKFFGAEGEKQLESAYNQVGQTQDFYLKKAESVVFKTIDGKTLTSLEDIGNYMESQGKQGNVEAVEKGMDFMIAKGFINPKEKEYALKFVRQVREQGGIPDFDSCRLNPESCRDFIPEEQKAEFEAGIQVEQIMRAEIGFDPFECEKGKFDRTIGQKCLEGSRRALPKLEALRGKFKEVEFIIADIKKHIAQGEEFEKNKNQIQQVFQGQGGPGGCKSEQECFAFCSNPTNTPECISFGAKQGVFRGSEAVDKFQQFNNVLQSQQLPTTYVQQAQQNQFQGGFQGGYQFQGGFPGQGYGVQGGFPGQGYGVQGGFPGGGGSCPLGAHNMGSFCMADLDLSRCGPYGSTSVSSFESCSSYPGGGFPGGPPRQFGGPGPVGPSPECFTAIQSGDFARAKAVCSVTPVQIDVRTQQTLTPGTPLPPNLIGVCPRLPSVDYCPGGYKKVVSFSSPECGTYYSCQPDYQQGTYSPYPTGGEWPTDKASCTSRSWNWCTSQSSSGWCQSGPCPSGDYPYSPYPTGGTYSPYPTGPAVGSCSQSLINLLGTGCHQMYTDSTGRTIFCNNEMTTSAKEGDTATTAGCAGGYQPYPSGSPGGSYTPSPSCPSGQWWDYSRNACMSSTSTYSPYPTGSYTYTPAPSCPSGQWWDYSRNACVSSTSTYSPYPTSTYTYSPSPTGGTSSCPSGSHVMGSNCMSDADTTKCGPLGSTSVSSFTPCSGYQSTTTYTYSPSPTGGTSSCPSGSHVMGSNCMSDADTTKCGPLGSTSVSSFTPCSSYQSTTTYTYSPYPTYSPTYSYTPYPTSSYTSSPYPTAESTTTTIAPIITTTTEPTTTTTYVPTTTYYSATPYPTCPSGQWWDTATSSCHASETHSIDSVRHQMAVAKTIMACADSGGEWNAGKSVCAKSGGGFFANVLKVFSKFIIGR